ncbi:MAG: hypothetical protein AAF567_15055 [Actinomycetota bacterium]
MELQDHAEEAGAFWRDADGFLSPVRPGVGPRRDPVGDFPTGPAVGERLPAVVALDTAGQRFEIEVDRAGQAAIVVFHRSAVW